MNKHLKGLRAVALSALLGLTLIAGVVMAQGFPTQVVLNSEVGNTANGYIAGAATSTTNTPLLLCSQPATCGWVNRVIFDSAVGASSTVQVIFYDATSTAMCTSSAVIGSFSLVTTSANVLANVGNNGYFTQGGGVPNQTLDWLVHGGLYVATVSNNPNTVTASVVLGKPVNAGASVLTR